MSRVKRHIPAMLYTLLSLLGLALLLDGALGSDWVFCRLTSVLCVSGPGLVGTLLLALYGALGLLTCVAFAAMLYRVLRQGGARMEVNHADRLLVGRAITDIRALCKQGEFGKALLLVETLRRKYPQNRQLRELEQRLHRALDDQGVS